MSILLKDNDVKILTHNFSHTPRLSFPINEHKIYWDSSTYN